MGDISRNKMALSRPLMQNFRKFSTSQALRSGDHGPDGYKRWRTMTYVICFPAVALATFVNFGPTATHEHRPEFKPYEYMRVRSKAFPWGDGNHSLSIMKWSTPCLMVMNMKKSNTSVLEKCLQTCSNLAVWERKKKKKKKKKKVLCVDT